MYTLNQQFVNWIWSEIWRQNKGLNTEEGHQRSDGTRLRFDQKIYIYIYIYKVQILSCISFFTLYVKFYKILFYSYNLLKVSYVICRQSYAMYILYKIAPNDFPDNGWDLLSTKHTFGINQRYFLCNATIPLISWTRCRIR